MAETYFLSVGHARRITEDVSVLLFELVYTPACGKGARAHLAYDSACAVASVDQPALTGERHW
jgi:hypothetical protein